MKINFKEIISFTGILLFAACSTDVNENVPEALVDEYTGKPIVLNVSANPTLSVSRAGYSADNMPSVLYFTIDQQGSNYDYTNVELTLEEGVYVQPIQMCWANSSRDVDIRAWTLPVEGASAMSGVQTVSVKADQSLETDLQASDMLGSSYARGEMTVSGESVNIRLYHLFSKVFFSIAPEEGLTDFSVKSVGIHGVRIHRTFDYGQVDFCDDSEDLTANDVVKPLQTENAEEGTVGCEAVLLPQTFAEGSEPYVILLVDVAGQEFPVKATLPIQELASGKAYSFNMTFGLEKATVDAVSLVEWEAESYDEVLENEVPDGVFNASGLTWDEITSRIEGALAVGVTDFIIYGNLIEAEQKAVSAALTSAANGTIDLTLAETASVAANAFEANVALSGINLPMATSVGNYAMRNCTALTGVNLPVVTSLGTYVFYGCTGLPEVELPVATGVGSYAFYGCTALTTVSAPAAKSVDSYAFNGCTKLVTVNLPVVTALQEEAFYGCTALQTLEFPSVTTLEKRSLGNCKGLVSLTFGSPITNWYYPSYDFYGVLYNASTSNITLTLSPNQKEMSQYSGYYTPGTSTFGFTSTSFCGNTFKSIVRGE